MAVPEEADMAAEEFARVFAVDRQRCCAGSSVPRTAGGISVDTRSFGGRASTPAEWRASTRFNGWKKLKVPQQQIEARGASRHARSRE
jgi:hypothetical protein